MCSQKNEKNVIKLKRVVDVSGDGNCWYRCTLVRITNSEDYHDILRMNSYKVTILKYFILLTMMVDKML